MPLILTSRLNAKQLPLQLAGSLPLLVTAPADMKQVAFQALSRQSERAAAENLSAYRQQIYRTLYLGWAYAFGLPILGASLVVLAVLALFLGWQLYWALTLALVGSVLGATAMHSVRMRVAKPQGYFVQEEQAPELFRMLAKIQHKLQAPPIHHVLLTTDFSARILPLRRFDFWGKTQNYLCLGLPYVISASPERLLALIAQEYAHLRGDDDKIDTYVYRLRRTWQHLLASDNAARRPRSVVMGVGHAFMRWYRPRFLAQSFALARLEEYAADLAASKVYSRNRMAEALIENAIVAHHVEHEHWRQFWQLACRQTTPEKLPFAWLAGWNIKPPKARAVSERFAELRREVASHNHTPPPVRERVIALKRTLEVPPPSPRHAGVLLGKAFDKAIAQFDQAWWRENESRWRILRQQFIQDQHKIEVLQEAIDGLQVKELERLAQLYQRQMREADADMVFGRIRALEQHNAYALWRQIEWMMERGDKQVLVPLAEMVDRYPEHQRRAILLAVEILERLPATPEVQDLLNSWLERLDLYEEQDQAYWQDIESSPLMAYTQPHLLSAYQLEDLIASAQRLPSILKMWILEKGSRNYSWHKAYVAVVLQNPGNRLTPEQLVEQLVLPGKVFCIDIEEIGNLSVPKSQADLGSPSYVSSKHAFKPAARTTGVGAAPQEHP